MNESAPSRIPLAVKLAYTAFLCVLVPFYWHNYGPANFLYFCDVALFMTLIAVWWESPVFASAPAVGILIPQLLWMVDFLSNLFGVPLTGMTNYMFDESNPLFNRGLSFFHFWLPILLVWLVSRLGYDKRGLVLWTLAAWILVPVCYFFFPGPPAVSPGQIVNINYVHGFSEDKPQEWLPPLGYLAALMIVLPTCIYFPVHLVLQKLFPQKCDPTTQRESVPIKAA